MKTLSNESEVRIMREEFIPVERPAIGKEEMKAVQKALKTDYLIGPKGKIKCEFEKRFTEFIGVKYGIALSSGTAALHTAFYALGIGPGDEVIVPALSFVASGDAIRYTGATPVFVDVDSETYNIDFSKIEDRITDNTKGIEVVHLYGLPADMEPILKIARGHGLYVVEDAAQSHGAKYREKKTGSLGHAAGFSFWGNKNMTTAGGGFFVTDSEEISELAELFSFAGEAYKTKPYQHVLLGHNYIMSEVLAAIGLVQLNKLEDFIKKRRENAEYLSEGLSGLDMNLPYEPEGCRHSFNQYVLRCKKRDYLRKELNKRNIQTKLPYPPIPYQPSYKKYGYRRGSFPVTERIVDECLLIPVHPLLTKDELDRIIESTKTVLK
ncbi:MAG: DegT/DnrJ/EryC1/StrS family aminotransferase [Candidatus Hodarchaeota archaeon]